MFFYQDHLVIIFNFNYLILCGTNYISNIGIHPAWLELH